MSEDMKIKGVDVEFDPEKHKVGNVTFQPGNGWSPDSKVILPVGGDFIFKLPDGTEMLRIKPDGSFLVRADKVADDKKLYTAFAEWMKNVSVDQKPGEYNIG